MDERSMMRSGHRQFRPLGRFRTARPMVSRREKEEFRSEVYKIHDIIKDSWWNDQDVQDRNFTRYFHNESSPFNNAEKARYFNPFALNVAHRGYLRSDFTGITREDSVCNRSVINVPPIKQQYCDVLGMDYCSDCSRISERNLRKFEIEPKLYIMPQFNQSVHNYPMKRVRVPQMRTPLDVFNRVYSHNKYTSELTNLHINHDIQHTDLPNHRPKSIY